MGLELVCSDLLNLSPPSPGEVMDRRRELCELACAQTRDIDDSLGSKRRWFGRAQRVLVVNGLVIRRRPRTERRDRLSLLQVSRLKGWIQISHHVSTRTQKGCKQLKDPTVTNFIEKQQIRTFKVSTPAKLWHFCLKNVSSN